MESLDRRASNSPFWGPWGLLDLASGVSAAALEVLDRRDELAGDHRRFGAFAQMRHLESDG